MGQLRIMAPGYGDELVAWDEKDPASVEKAEKKFNELTEKGMTAYKVDRQPQRKGEPVKKFSKKAKEYIFAPALSGG